MAPTLGHGDLLVATAVGALHRGSLVVVEHPGRPGYDMVKRVEGLPDEDRGGRTLGQGEFWLAGDNPDASTDSRTFGPVPREAIRGVVRARYWPRPRWFGSEGH
jgi:nickel-type superoxide dismutase maturation protease